ncbi:MAG: ABC transporter ATP-binding protein [Verrucomicrobiae bacterium]|nr:ABC transporter ATP-binding protein [Verrucomicrobiae bacterium]
MIVLDQVTVAAGAFELRDVSFAVPTGSYAALMGRTGSGKTTLLEAICGLRTVTSGRILLHGRNVTRLPPADRGVGFVPQEGALFRHLTVREHLEFALVIRKQPPDAIRSRVAELASWLGLEPLLDRRPQGLSGGETQRVALGRALSFQPAVLCLDEPLSALDDESREATCAVLETLRARTGVTVLHITHNLAEANRLADIRLRIHHGKILPDIPGPR